MILSNNGAEEVVVREVRVSELEPDRENANRGTVRGASMIEASLRELGAGRSILIDKNGRVIAGNKTLQAAAEIGLDNVIIVKSDGRSLVAVQRDDLDLESDDSARRLALFDNRTSEVDLVWDVEQLLKDEHLLEGLFTDEEMRLLLERAESELDLSQFSQVDNPEISYRVSIESLSVEQAEELASELSERYEKIRVEQVKE